MGNRNYTPEHSMQQLLEDALKIGKNYLMEKDIKAWGGTLWPTYVEHFKTPCEKTGKDPMEILFQSASKAMTDKIYREKLGITQI